MKMLIHLYMYFIQLLRSDINFGRNVSGIFDAKNRVFGRSVGGCMYKDIYTPLQIQALLQPVFAAYKIKKATLFGSYAKGLAEERSDIDILVDSGLKGLAFFGLLEDVVTTLGKEVDLLDISQLTPDSQIREEIKRNGVVIYEQ